MLIIEKIYILALGEGPAQELDDTKLTEEHEQHKKFSLSLYYNEVNSYILVKDVEIHNFKAKYSEMNASPLLLGNISK